MKIYLDDMRKAPFGWERVYTADQCIDKLKTGQVQELSLDHDLDEEHYQEEVFEALEDKNSTYEEAVSHFKIKTGYSVVQWMVENNVWPSVIILHTMNPVGRDAMKSTIERYAPKHVLLEIKIGWRG